MYSAGDDKLVVLKGVPEIMASSACAPHVAADEWDVVLAYHVNSPESVSDLSMEEIPVAVIHFKDVWSHTFGHPNEEAIQGHPLEKLGLRPCRAHEVMNSSWIKELAQMNSVHPNHTPETLAGYTHFIFAFWDSTFECVAKDYSWEETKGLSHEVLPGFVARLRKH